MGAQPVTGRGGQPRPGPGGRAKSGKPRPGTGGYGKHKLAGKGPTPPARLRPGHPAQRKAALQAKKAAQGSAGPGNACAASGARTGRVPGRSAGRGNEQGEGSQGAGRHGSA